MTPTLALSSVRYLAKQSEFNRRDKGWMTGLNITVIHFFKTRFWFYLASFNSSQFPWQHRFKQDSSWVPVAFDYHYASMTSPQCFCNQRPNLSSIDPLQQTPAWFWKPTRTRTPLPIWKSDCLRQTPLPAAAAEDAASAPLQTSHTLSYNILFKGRGM